MANIYVKSGGGTIGAGTWRGLWSASQTWAVGDRIVATNVISYRVMECTTGGAGGAGAEPTWNVTTGGTTTDNAAVWTTRIPSTWANATVDLTRAAANDAAGDTIYVSHQHAESTAAVVSLSWAGTIASPVRVLCVNDGAEPPTALATTASVMTTGNNNIVWGSGVSQTTYCYGITFTPGSGATGTASFSTEGAHVFESSDIVLSSTGAVSRIHLQNGSSTQTSWVNCGYKYGNAAHGLSINTAGCVVDTKGGSLLAGGTSPTALLVTLQAGSTVSIDGLNLTNASSSLNLSSVNTASCNVVFRNCRLPASWSGSLHSGTPGHGSVFEMFNCDGGDTNYRYRKAAEFGTIQEETTLVRTGGASDGTTAYSWRLVTNANAEYPLLTLDTPEIVRWNDTTGSAITVTVEILHDSATNMKDDGVWLEVMYLGTSGVPLGSFTDDAAADVLATAADQTASSTTWTTTGMANPNKQKLSVTFTPQEKGFIHAVVKCALASKTLYVDPMITVS